MEGEIEVRGIELKWPSVDLGGPTMEFHVRTDYQRKRLVDAEPKRMAGQGSNGVAENP